MFLFWGVFQVVVCFGCLVGFGFVGLGVLFHRIIEYAELKGTHQDH